MSITDTDLLVNGHPFPPPGWTPHPDSPGWWYRGTDVLNRDQLIAKFSRYTQTDHGGANGAGKQVASERMVASMAGRRENMMEVIETAGTHHQDAIDKLAAIMADPAASSAQVRACESIISWAAGAPERFVHIALELRSKTVGEAMDAVIAATMEGHCSLESGQALMAMLRQKAEVADMAALQQQISELRDMVQTVATGGRMPATING